MKEEKTEIIKPCNECQHADEDGYIINTEVCLLCSRNPQFVDRFIAKDKG